MRRKDTKGSVAQLVYTFHRSVAGKNLIRNETVILLLTEKNRICEIKKFMWSHHEKLACEICLLCYQSSRTRLIKKQLSQKSEQNE